MRLLDTFAGVGWFRLALQKSIWSDNIDCIGYSEIDKFAKTVYDYRFPDTPDLGDISKIDIDSLPDFDILTGGFPCQDVSVAGKQDLDNGRTVLVEYLLRILEDKQPEWFVFENVKWILSSRFEDFFESLFSNPISTGFMLLITGIILYITENIIVSVVSLYSKYCIGTNRVDSRTCFF